MERDELLLLLVIFPCDLFTWHESKGKRRYLILKSVWFFKKHNNANPRGKSLAVCLEEKKKKKLHARRITHSTVVKVACEQTQHDVAYSNASSYLVAGISLPTLNRAFFLNFTSHALRCKSMQHSLGLFFLSLSLAHTTLECTIHEFSCFPRRILKLQSHKST